MRIAQVKIENFRGIKRGTILFPEHGILVGDNNTGKSTILEAIDLVLGPDRMRRRPVICEHDFFAGDYYDGDKNPIEVKIEVIIVDLTDEQKRTFNNHVEWWDTETNSLLDSPPAEATDSPKVLSALRVGFTGKYDEEEDDFVGKTYFLLPEKDDGEHLIFKARDKRVCGFLYLRTLRTGSRALSLERGSLLDIILQLNEVKPKMWEETLEKLRGIPVAENPELGISAVLSSVQTAIRSLVPSDWGAEPQMRVSDLTREHLRKTLNVFLSTGIKKQDGSDHIAPFKYQGSGTVNTLVLSMLSLIGDLKKNVIFAMEEPEIAIPPHTQKRIVTSIRKKSKQAIFSSHSPYILEEFDPSQIIVLKNKSGVLSSDFAKFPSSIKKKAYQAEFRKRYCEALLAKRVLIAEGKTEYDSVPAAARRLNDLNPEKYSSLEALGIAIINAETDSQIEPISEILRKFGKETFAVYDLQSEPQKSKIKDAVDHPFESSESSFEKLILNGIPDSRLMSFALSIVDDGLWPPHLSADKPVESSTPEQIKDSLSKYFKGSKGAATTAQLLESCSEEEFPQFLKDILGAIKSTVEQSDANTLNASNEDHSGSTENPGEGSTEEETGQ